MLLYTQYREPSKVIDIKYYKQQAYALAQKQSSFASQTCA
jgi:hypothetical protein